MHVYLAKTPFSHILAYILEKDYLFYKSKTRSRYRSMFRFHVTEKILTATIFALCQN